MKARPLPPGELRAIATELADAAVLALIEEVRPGHYLGVLLEQGPALAFGHPSPNAELHLVIQRVCPALLHYRSVTADHRGLALGGPPDKKFVRIGLSAQCFGYPGNPFLCVDSAESAVCSRQVRSARGRPCS